MQIICEIGSYIVTMVTVLNVQCARAMVVVTTFFDSRVSFCEY